MFRPMRRIKQQLNVEHTEEILKKGTTGILAVNGDGGYPYTVPVNYVYFNGKIYVHCAREGHKIDAVKSSSKVSFCVVDSDEVLAQKLTTLYRSVIVFGSAEIIEGSKNDKELIKILTALGLKYNCGEKETQKEIINYLDKLSCIEITPKHITGKMGYEFLKSENN